MATILVRLDSRRLSNPDVNIRYVLPDLLVERSAGVISDDGYDFVGEESFLVLFLKAFHLEAALACVLDVVENVRVLDNDLRSAAVVAVQREGGPEVIYPPDFAGSILSPAN